MALTTCSECAQGISTLADRCPHCGAPVLPAEGDGAGRETPVAEEPMPRRKLTPAEVIGGLVFVVVCVFFATRIGTGASLARSSSVATERALRVSSLELEQAYQENSVAADNRFKGQRLLVSGIAASINTDISNDAYIVLDGPGFMTHAQAHLASSERPSAAGLHPGDAVTVLCTGAGDVLKSPILRDCTFAPVAGASSATEKMSALAYAAEPTIKAKLRQMLGSRYEEFTSDAEGPGSMMDLQDGFLVGSFCRPHLCGVQEALIAHSVQNGLLIVVLLRNAKDADVFGVPDVAHIPAPVSAWIAERRHGG